MASQSFIETPPLKQQPTIRQHNTFQLELRGYSEKYATITSDFDSGNILSAFQQSEHIFRLQPCSDIEGVTSSKNWFYFKALGFPAKYRAKFVLSNMNCLYSFGRFFNNRKDSGYKPCRKINDGEWEKFDDGVAVQKNEGNDTLLKFEHTFGSEDEEVAFAFTYPYEYSKYLQLTEELENKYANQQEMCFRKQLVTNSLEQRPIYMFTITSGEEKKIGPERSRKPIVFITSRVHPGEVPASYTIQGVIRFLLSKKDLRAYILRRMFSFKIIPMLNPDGVYRGHYRMDSLGQNLNRYYSKDCNKQTQPVVYAVKGLIQKYSKQQKLLFYFDLHAHAGRKGSFIYGNSISNFIQQVEANVFCRIMALNTPFFEYSCCNFSQKHMTHKDKNQQLTKDNCGRVFAYKSSGIIHSFTLELGYHFTNLQSSTSASNTSFEMGKYKYIQSPKNQSKLFTPQSFAEVGQALLISILDCLNYNPYTKIPNGQYQTLALLRRVTAFNLFQSDQRYKTFDMKTYPKVKNINSIINQSYYDKVEKMFRLSEIYKRLFHSSEWNNCVEAAAKKNEKVSKIEQDILDSSINANLKKKTGKEQIRTIEDEILSQKSENSSESSDVCPLVEQMRETNTFQKRLEVFRMQEMKKDLLEITEMKYGSATMVKNQLPILQSRGATPTVRNMTSEKQKKCKPILEIQTLKLKIKQEFARELKSELNKQQHQVFNGSKLQRRQQRSLKKVVKDIASTNTNPNLNANNNGTNLQIGSINVNVSSKLMINSMVRQMSPINIKALQAPRLSHIYLPFLSK